MTDVRLFKINSLGTIPDSTIIESDNESTTEFEQEEIKDEVCTD